MRIRAEESDLGVISLVTGNVMSDSSCVGFNWIQEELLWTRKLLRAGIYWCRVLEKETRDGTTSTRSRR